MPLTLKLDEKHDYKTRKLPLERLIQYDAFCGNWRIGWITRNVLVNDQYSWVWNFLPTGRNLDNKDMPVRDHGAKPTLDEAMADYRANFEKWLKWAALAEASPEHAKV